MKTRHALWKKALASALASTTALGYVPLSYGAAIDIADIPLSVKYRPRPNLIMAVDDSGSMDSEVLLSTTTNDGAVWWYASDKAFWGRDSSDNTASGWVPNFNKSGNASGSWKKYVYLFPNGTAAEARTYSDSSDDHFAIPPVPEYAAYRSYTYNRMYYNPAVKYDPWLPYSSGSTTVTPAAATPTAARSHPILGTATLDLTVNVSSNSANWTFRMYPGMTMPGGATASTNRYRTCSTANNGTCGTWTDVGTANKTVSSVCSGAPTCDHVDVQIQYYPATYHVSELDTVAYPLYTTGTGGVSTILSVTPPDSKKLKEVKISTAKSYPKVSKAREDCTGAVGSSDGCSGAAEMQNFANWFQYYRKRHLMLNAGLGNSLSGVKNLRAGYFLFNNRANATVYDFNSTDVSKNALAFLGSVYKTKGDGGTPTRASLDFLGQQFKRTDKDASGNYNVIQAACQYNAGFVITDGFASDNVTITPNNYDGQATSATYPYNAQYSSTQPGTVNAGPTNPYKDNYNNTLGDIAMKYYTENPRTDLATGKVTIDENDAGPDADRNRNLHMNTYGIGLGVKGETFGEDAAATLNPYSTAFSWKTDPTSVTRHPSSVDDLWHATINGRGLMFSANSPEEVRNGLQDVINGVVAKGNGNAAVSVSNSNPTPGDNYTYFSTYNAGSWAGELNARTIDLTSGDLKAEATWSNPGKLLASMTDPLNQRYMATYDPTTNKGLMFRWTGGINSTQKAQLGNDPDVLTFLRGDRSDEGVKFRSRGARPPFANGITPDNIAVLGDIVNAEPVFVGQPKRSYADVGYTAFKANSTYANRKKVVYQGANDGMLHAFESIYGNELWTYIPSLVFPNLKNLSEKTTFKHRYYVDGTPAAQDVDFNNTYGKTPPTDAAGTDWRTILVGALGKGGRGYYALDVTNPNAASDADVASKVLWEFPNSDPTGDGVGNGKNVGYSYGKPLILKTRATGWVAMITSGLNNGSDDADGAGSFGSGTGPGGDGKGHLWVLNPLTGKVIKDMPTTAGSAADPSNLLYINAFARNSTIDATIDFVFGGDMQGNVWVWDFTGASISDWTVTKLATVQDASNNPQPITVTPEVSLVSGKPMVYFGTGQYFGESDVRDFSGSSDAVVQNAASKQQHSVYGIWADWTIDPVTGKRSFLPIAGNPRTSALVQRTVSRDCAKLTTQVGTDPKDTLPIDFGSQPGQQRGWFFDLPAASCNTSETPIVGERIVVRPSLTGGVLQLVGNIPNSTDPCSPGGSSWLYSVNYLTGGGVTDGDVEGLFLGSALASRPVMITLPSGKVVSFVRMNASNVSDATKEGGLRDADTFTKGRPVQALDPKLLKLQTKGKRFTWRELFQ